MRTIQIVFAVALMVSAAPAFAKHGGKGGHGACSAYEATCTSDPSVSGATDKKSKRKAMKACVSAAATADAANGQKCLDAKAKHHHKD